MNKSQQAISCTYNVLKMIKESIIDLPRKSYDTSVFLKDQQKPDLRPDVRQQLLDIVSSYSQWGRISEIMLIGSILTKQYNPNTDLDVTVIMEPFSEKSFEAAQANSTLSQAGNDLLAGTDHPITVFARLEWDETPADQIYDVLRNKWKKQTEVGAFDVGNYMQSFTDYVHKIDLDKGELERDLIDYDMLQDMGQEDIKGLSDMITGKIDEIDDAVKKLSGSYKTIWTLRKLSFDADMTPQDIKDYQIKNKLPANVVYKLLERYHYTRFLRALRQVLKDADGEIDTPAEVQDVKQVLQKGESATIEDVTNLIDRIALKELTGSGGAGGYDVPLGATPAGRIKKKKKKKKELKGIKVYN